MAKLFKSRIFLALLLVFTLKSGIALAGEFVEDQPSSSDSSDSTFDPFSDYSEFEAGSEEEADTNFFRNGRFFSISINGGYETFTDILGQMYKPDITYGANITYFFDLKFGFQIGYQASGHTITVISNGTTYTGKVNLSNFNFNAKYYFNTQNVKKGLGSFNPYLIGGLSANTERQQYNTGSGAYEATAVGFQGGVGVEIPFMRNKMYFGAQAMYCYVAFPERSSPLPTASGAPTNIYPTGDAINFTGMIGFNF